MSPADDIRTFAALCARLDDPFAETAAVLREAGLDAPSWAAVRARWLSKLDPAGPDAALVAVFGEAYAAALRPAIGREQESRSRMAIDASPASDPVPEDTPAPGPAQEARPVEVPSFLKGPPARPVPAAPQPAEPSHGAAPPPPPPLGNETTEINLAQILGGRLPFDPSKPSTASVPLVAPKPKGPMSGETTDIDVAALARAALAFRPGPGGPSGGPKTAELPAPPAPPAAVANEGQVPGRRLVRFDPKTGTPLATPYWEDVPPGGNKR